MPDRVFSLSSSGTFPLSDLLGSYRMRHVFRTDHDTVFVFSSSKAVFLFGLYFCLRLGGCKERGTFSYGTVVTEVARQND
jgi:hypothetical protein